MKDVKARPAVTIVGSVLLIALVLGAVVWLRASKESDAERAMAAMIPSKLKAAQAHKPSAGVRAAVGAKLAAAALQQTARPVAYDASYVRLDYPGGDVPQERGVCSDVIVRAYRQVGLDLQKLVHEDMSRNFAVYPHLWGAGGPDPNIDHRRVPNLMTFFQRRGSALPVTAKVADYRPGDVVAWDLGSGRTHIGLVVWPKAAGNRPLVVHNIGPGPKAEDVLFAWKLIGHYRYPASSNASVAR
jgi:hypothetical protein